MSQPQPLYQQARLSRDHRFDGLFFVAVKTTRIYCRPICPAPAPKEENVTYYTTAAEAAANGYRPCLRCRPDSAPGSPAWRGTDAMLGRAIRLIDQGILAHISLPQLSDKLGVSDRYLRKLFKSRLGMSPKAYALYQQSLFAKKLLHQTGLSITEIALASGFGSVRRFNDNFQKQLGLTPSQLRKQTSIETQAMTITLAYRPPYDWHFVQQFLAARAIEGLEWVTENSYGRTFDITTQQDMPSVTGYFTATHHPDKCCFEITLHLDDLTYLKPVIQNIRRLLDLDLDSDHLATTLSDFLNCDRHEVDGLRLPGIWSCYEAGLRAILGQQISVKAAHALCQQIINELGDPYEGKRIFPQPAKLADHSLDFLKMPGKRKQTIRDFATHYLTHPDPDNPDCWADIKGVGPWTCDYARLRGQSQPDIFLGGDLGVKKALSHIATPKDIADLSPWRSYLTFYLWKNL